MKVLELNHVALNVEDVDRSSRFYSLVLGLEPMPRPAFTFPGAWFRVGAKQELHLIGGLARTRGAIPPPRERHFAFRVESIDDAAAHLRKLGYDFTGPQLRPDGARQIFLRDPDGHAVELFTGP